MIVKFCHFQNPFWGLRGLLELSIRLLQLRSTLFPPGILVFPARAPEFVDRYQFLAPKDNHLFIRTRDLQSVLRPRALRVGGYLFAEGEVCREPHFSRSRPSCSWNTSGRPRTEGRTPELA